MCEDFGASSGMQYDGDSLLVRVSNGEIGLIGVDGLFARPGNKASTSDDLSKACAVFVAVNVLVILLASLVGFEGSGFLPSFFFTVVSFSSAGLSGPNDNAACFNFGAGLCSRGLSVGVRIPWVLRAIMGFEFTTTSG